MHVLLCGYTLSIGPTDGLSLCCSSVVPWQPTTTTTFPDLTNMALPHCLESYFSCLLFDSVSSEWFLDGLHLQKKTNATGEKTQWYKEASLRTCATARHHSCVETLHWHESGRRCRCWCRRDVSSVFCFWCQKDIYWLFSGQKIKKILLWNHGWWWVWNLGGNGGKLDCDMFDAFHYWHIKILPAKLL